MRKTRLLLAFPMLVTAISVIDHGSTLISRSHQVHQLVADLLSASMIMGLALYSPYLLQWLAVKPAKVDPPGAFDVLETCTAVLGFSPRLVVLDSPKLEASCAGSGRTSTVFVTTGFLRRYSSSTVRATAAHEASHLRLNHSMHQALMFSCLYLAGRWVGLPSMAMPVLMLGYLAVCRAFEFAADQLAAEHVGEEAVIQMVNDLRPATGPSTLRHARWWSATHQLLCSHPSFDNRVSALKIQLATAAH